MADVKKLEIVESFSIENDRRIVANKLPVFSSSIGTETLACGGCGGIIARSVTTSHLYQSLQDTSRVVVTCTCGTHNLLVSERRNRPR